MKNYPWPSIVNSDDLKEQVVETLKVYPNAYLIELDNKEKVVSNTTFLCEQIPIVGTLLTSFNVDSFFTEKEQILNYLNAFQNYPHWYTGERDYEMLSKLNYTPEKYEVVFDKTQNDFTLKEII